MIRIVRAFVGMLMALACASGYAQFNSGQVLTATGLNAALASPVITGGTINGSVIGATNPKAGTFTNLSVTGSLTATGLVMLPSLATQAANTVIANASGSTASPTAFAMPSCSGANNALRWTSGTGFACASSIALTSSGLNQFAATTSAQLASIVSDETGSGSLVFGTNPTIAGATFTAPTSVTGNGVTLTVTNSNNSDALDLVGTTGANGAILKFIGNGSTTPSKTIRVSNGTFGIINDAFSNTIFSLTDAGSMTASGGLNNTAVGNVTASTGVFTSLSATGGSFTGALTVGYSSPTFNLNDTSGTNQVAFTFQKGGTSSWYLYNTSSTGAFGLARVVGGSYADSPITVSNSTGAVSLADGLSVTGTTGLGTPTSVGTSVFPTIVAPVSTTATTTNGSTSITVTSASGIAVGMGIYATFVDECSLPNAAYSKAYVTAVSGTTVTMNCPATATNSTAVAVQFGQQRYSTTSSVIASDVGTQTLKVGSASQGNSAAWLNQISTGQDYRMTSAAQIVSPPTGGYALTLGARSSDATSGAAAFPLQSFLYLDSWGNTGYGAENVYLQDNLLAATAGHAQPHIQMEQSINSQWGTPPAEDPFFINQVNQTIAHRYDCGTGQSTTTGFNGCTSAIDIVPNPQTFQNGIVVANGALDTGGGTRQANVISMPLMTGFTWYSAASTYSAAQYSPSAGVLNSLVPAGGQFNFIINGSTAVNITSTGLNSTAIGQSTPAPGSFTSLSATGSVSGISGRLLNIQTFASGGTYTPTSGANRALVCGVGGGGAGGGAPATSTGQASIGGGGSAGAFGCIYVSSGLSSQTVTIGAAGAGASGANGGNGGQTSFGSLMTLPGGPGGSTAGPTSGNAVAVGTAQSGSPGGSGTYVYSSKGAYASLGMLATATSFASGTGANSNFGAGGPNQAGTGAGSAASGYGAGGGGAGAAASAAAQTGGSGTGGIVTVYEYQ